MTKPIEIEQHGDTWMATVPDLPVVTVFLAAEVGRGTGSDLYRMIASPTFESRTGNATTVVADGPFVEVSFDLPAEPGWETTERIPRADLLDYLRQWAWRVHGVELPDVES